MSKQKAYEVVIEITVAH